MTQRTCDAEGCERKHVARGLCSMHWKREHGRRTTYERTCDTCGETFKGFRPTARFCGDICKGIAYRFEMRRTSRELVHVGPAESVSAVTWLPAQHPAMRPVPKVRYRIWYAGSCAWCAEGYLTLWPQGRFCSDRCQRAQGRADYKIARGVFAIPRSTRLAIYGRDRWTCQLCMEPVDQGLMATDPQNEWAPSLDHIECQAWTLIPDHSPENLRLAHRWCNSVRGDGRWHTEDVLRAPAA